MAGIGLAYKTPEQQSASNFDAGARAVTQPPASPGIGMAAVPVSPVEVSAPPSQPIDATTPQLPAAPAAAPAAPAAAQDNGPLIDFDNHPVRSIGLVMAAFGAGLEGKENPADKALARHMEMQAQQYKTAALAMDIVDKTSKFVSKLKPSDRAHAIADLDQRFSGALGGHSIAPFLTAMTAGNEAEAQARMEALKGMNVSPQMMAYFASDPEAAVKFVDQYNAHQASRDTPDQKKTDAEAVARGTNAAGADKPMTPAEKAANKISAENAGTSAASAAETARHNKVVESDVTNKPLTQDQATAATYADRAHEANAIIDKHGATQGTSLKGRSLEKVPGGNYAQSPDYQKNSQAERNFVNAVLRKESGSAINPSEFDSAAKQYFPQPGDTPEVIKQKAVNRSTVINGLRREAGPSYKPPAPIIKYDAQGNRITN